MKRITIWITATLAAVALLVAFQLNATGNGGKSGENDRQHSVSPSGKPGENK
ncbi:hypothetical protein ACIA8G_13140 [Lentzea sp. NPDC051213]|uniref:hypothetical protein n=1 Tax=Lentzea sp. NPDC051213 TaxID=3364126 RepID=UPI0037A4B364